MKRNIIKATGLIFALSFISKIIGFLKSIIQASYFGTTIETDAFNIASGFVSNVLYMLTTAIAVAFVPLYIQNKLKNNEKRFASSTITLLSLFSIVLTVLLVVFAPFIIRIIAPGYTGQQMAITVEYFRILILGIVFSLTTNIYINLLNAERIYGFSAFTSIINSIVIIVLILLFAEKWGVLVLAIAMPVSFLVQWLILFGRGRKYGSFTLRYGVRDKEVYVLIAQAIPILLSQATVEINQVVDRALLISVDEGVLTAVSYSAVLYQFVSTLISTPISTVFFTELSEAGANHNLDETKTLLNNGFKVLVILCIPIIIDMLFSSNDIVSIIYGHGKFGGDSIYQCAIGLQMYGLCLLPGCIKSLLSRAYYANNNTRRPMVISVLEVGLNIALSIVLVKKYEIYGVVGATAIASCVFIIVMLIDFNITFIRVFTFKIIQSYWKIFFSLLVSASMMLLLNKAISFTPIINFGVKTVIVFGLYGITLVLLREELVSVILKKIIKMIKSFLHTLPR